MQPITDKDLATANNPFKKNWQSPSIIFIAQNNINGGALPGVHEKNYQSSHQGFAPSIHFFYKIGGGKTTNSNSRVLHSYNS